ncbi:YaaC family protein [Virgibacillus sp. W0430]|uniref:YaaC family protein n=1 Tax=Virgibacillus sp. W0430 TaxID=3391580 RepID=UPI003F48E7DD
MDKHKIVTFLTYLQSQQTAQQYLLHCYSKRKVKDAPLKSYENSNRFLYYLQHGRQFYKTGETAETFIQPILYYYGLTHLIKAIVLTIRPNYPETSSILAHGVSTRRRKKKQYTFLHDEVKAQQNGLFPYFAEHVYGIKKQALSKWNMKALLASIPELNTFFHFNNKEQGMVAVGNLGTTEIHFPLRLLDHYHLTTEALIQRIRPYLPQIGTVVTDKEKIHITLTVPVNEARGPFKINNDNDKIYFPSTRDMYEVYSESINHYLILYNLSMICRYETEWWGDLLGTKSDVDYPLIAHYLQVARKKVPLLIGYELLKQSPFG